MFPNGLYYGSGATLSALLMAAAAWIICRRRLTPAERERHRREYVNRWPRTVEGTIMNATAEIIHYQYEIHGVAYFASQDVSALQGRLPEQPERLAGTISVKYDPRNPANSIIVSERWSGLPVIKTSKENQDADQTELAQDDHGRRRAARTGGGTSRCGK